MVELHYSRFRLVLGVVVTLGFVVMMGLWVVIAVASGHALLRLIAMTCLPLVLLAGLTLWPLLRAWRHQGPAVVMDGEGVTDLRQSHQFVAWKDIEKVELGFGRSSNYLCFTVRDAVRERGDVPGGSALLTLWRRLNQTGDWKVDLRLIAGSRHQIWQQARQMREAGLRQHVLRMRETLPTGAPAVTAAAGEIRLEH